MIKLRKLIILLVYCLATNVCAAKLQGDHICQREEK